jgi:hypothetical protein
MRQCTCICICIGYAYAIHRYRYRKEGTLFGGAQRTRSTTCGSRVAAGGVREGARLRRYRGVFGRPGARLRRQHD